MRISRLDLDGAWSAAAIVTRIFEIEPDLPIPVPIETLCERLDIYSIAELHTEGFEAALLADGIKSIGSILVKGGRSRRRRRFSIAHELGHFLIPAHKVPAEGPLLCTGEQLTLADPREQDRRGKWEVEANQFAAMLLMPPPALKAKLRQLRQPDLFDIVRWAGEFDVSKDAMARSYVQYHSASIAIVVTGHGRVLRHYRHPQRFPWITVGLRQPVPDGSLLHSARRGNGSVSAVEECEPDTWLGNREARMVTSLTEQVLVQQNGFALILLQAELRDDDEPDEGVDRVWQGLF